VTSRLRAVVLALSVAVFWWPITLGAGIAAAMCGAVAAVWAAETCGRARIGGRRLRTTSWLLLAVAVGFVGAALSHALVRWSGPADVLGSLGVLQLSQALFAFSLTAAVVFSLRLLASRHSALAIVELAAVATAFVASLAAHRDGMIHRPFAFGDLAWSRGIDPTYVFLALGGLCVLLLASLVVAEDRRRRLPLHFSVLLLVALFLGAIVRVSGLPEPRTPHDLELTGERAQGGQAGEQKGQLEDLEFKEEYRSDGGQAPVAVVLLHDDYSPPSGVYYFRQTAFTRYNGRRLVQSTSDEVDGDLVHHFPTERTEVRQTPPPSEERWPLRTTTGLLLDHIRPFALDSPITFEPAGDPGGLRFQRVYQALSLVKSFGYDSLLGQSPGSPDWSEEDWTVYSEAPSDPRYGELARNVTDQILEEYRGDPLAQALTIKMFLDEEGVYSRRNKHASADDPAASFLFGDLTGYCVHFAHAAVYMFRSLGIPARVAAGYAVPEEDRAGGSAIMIRGLNAHAWPEIYLEDAGWVVVDPAPRQSLDEFSPRADANLQQMLGEMLRDQARGEEQAAEAVQDPVTLADLLRFAGLLAGAALLALLSVKLYRALAPRVTRSEQQYRLAYRATLDRLSDVGMRRRFGESRERFAARASSLAPSFGPLTRVHLACALGGQASPGEQVGGLATSTRREIGMRVPAWRRLVGWLNPWAWILAR
jgi:hypothetical protein